MASRGSRNAIPRRLQERQVRGLLSSVPERARILEIDAIDGHKNLYYLPAGCSITQWLDEAPTATEEFKTNQTAKTKELDVRTVLPRAPDRPPKLPKDEFDVAFGVRCLQRALARGGSKAAKRLVDEVLARAARRIPANFVLSKGRRWRRRSRSSSTSILWSATATSS